MKQEFLPRSMTASGAVYRLHWAQLEDEATTLLEETALRSNGGGRGKTKVI